MSDHKMTHALRAELETFRDDGGPTVLQAFMPQLRSFLDSDEAIAYRLSADEHTVALDFLHADRLAAHQRRAFEDFYSRRSTSGTAFNPARPEPAQRNRALTFQHLERITGGKVKSAAIVQSLFPRLGVSGADQLRALICDGPSLLAWVGVFRFGRFEDRDRRRLQLLIPSIQRRLRLERQLSDHSFQSSALAAALEAISAAAFVVSRSGHIRHANQAGVALRDREGRALSMALSVAVESCTADRWFTISRFTDGGFLAIERQPNVRVTAASVRWHLTARQREVLALVAAGDPNKTIADKLGCALRTVEAHVTALLEKAQVDSRSALLARMMELG